MWAVLASALAARRGHAVIVALIALLASAATAVAPWYAVKATRQVAVDAMAGTPNLDRLVSVGRRVTGEQPAEEEARALRAAFDPPSFTTTVGAVTTIRLTGVLPAGGSGQDGGTRLVSGSASLAYREDVCGHLVVTGECPASPAEILVPVALAETHQLRAGDQLQVSRSTDEPARFRVVGTYQVRDATDPYWGGGELVGQRERVATREVIFTPLPAMRQFSQVTYTYELVADPTVLADIDIDELQTLVTAGLAELRRLDYAGSSTGITELADRVERDRRHVVLGIGVGVAVLLLLTWFTLVVVLRGAVTQLRGDVGWWRLHGAPTGRGWLTALGQSAVPLLGGALLGGAVGVGLGQVLGGSVPDPAAGRLAWLLATALVGVTVAGGLVAMIATKLDTLRTPVRDLLRRVPARGRRWRRSLVDLLVVVVAAAAVGQALVAGRAAEGVALLAPPLAVLAVALVAAWAVPPLAAAVAGRALYAGRLATALVAASLARRPGNHRVFALMAVTVALVTIGFVGWDRTGRDQWQRAALSTGAEQVLTVQRTDPAELLAAVRAADPSGAYAMAVVHRPEAGTHPAVLAVDSPRLGLVAGWRPEYGDEPARISELLRPPAPEPVVVTGDTLVLEAAGSGQEDISLTVLLRRLADGGTVQAEVGPVAAGPESYPAEVSGCAAGGCRLVGFELRGPPLRDRPGERDRPAPGSRVDLYRLTDASGGRVGAGVLADPTRWRPSLGPRDLGPIIGHTGGGGGVSFTVPEPGLADSLAPTYGVYVVDAPAPLPVLAAGWAPEPTDEVRVAPLPGAAVPVAVVGTASLVPVHARPAVLVDLEYADRLVPFPLAGSTAQVWLSATAPQSIVDKLEQAGVVPVRVESLEAAAERLGNAGGAVGTRFQTVVALVGLLLAAGAVLVFSTQERAGREAELAALRAQGLSRRTVRLVGYGGLVTVVAGAVLVGLVAGVFGAVLAQLLDPGFVDGWRLLPVPPYRPYPFAGAAVLAFVVLGGAALTAAAGLARRTRSRTRSRAGAA